METISQNAQAFSVIYQVIVSLATFVIGYLILRWRADLMAMEARLREENNQRDRDLRAWMEQKFASSNETERRLEVMEASLRDLDGRQRKIELECATQHGRNGGC